MENELNQSKSQRMVKDNQAAIHAIYSISSLALLLYIIFGENNFTSRILVSFGVLVAITLLMTVMFKVHIWPFK